MNHADQCTKGERADARYDTYANSQYRQGQQAQGSLRYFLQLHANAVLAWEVGIRAGLIGLLRSFRDVV